MRLKTPLSPRVKDSGLALFRAEGGFWKLFSDGVADIKVQEGHILIKLKE
jgi:hypothetical protein